MLPIIDDLSMYSRASAGRPRSCRIASSDFFRVSGIALADDLLVAVGLLLHGLDRDGAALPVVAVEQPVVGAGPDLP